MDEEVKHLIEVRKAKIDRLNTLDKQAATFGPLYTPPHIEMERVSLREELGMVETAIKSPARAEVSEELGPAGRFQVNYQQNRDIRESIAAVAVEVEGLAVKFSQFVLATMSWRSSMRTWIIIIGVTVLVLIIVVVSIVSYVYGRAGLV